MPANINVYMQDKVVVTINGIPMEDIAEGERISITRDRPRISKTLSTDGGGLFNDRLPTPAKISIPVLQHSKWITELTLVKNSRKPVAISVSDMNSYGNRTTYVGLKAMIQDPEVQYGEEAVSRVFEFEVINLTEVAIP